MPPTTDTQDEAARRTLDSVEAIALRWLERYEPSRHTNEYHAGMADAAVLILATLGGRPGGAAR